MTETTQRSTTALTTTIERPGEADALVTRAVPITDPGPGEVAIDVAFAGVNFAEVIQRRGVYEVPSWPFSPGLEVSGTVTAVGDGVDHLAAGDRVAAFCVIGGYSERVVTPASRVLPLPAGLGFEQAAAGLVTVTSAVAMLEKLAPVSSGAAVVVTAAAGGLGAVAAAVARACGAELLIGAVGSETKKAMALSHGYNIAVTYPEMTTAARDATGGRGVNVVLDSVGGAVLEAGLAALAPMGRLVKYGSASGETEALPAPMALAVANQSVMGWSSADLVLDDPAALRDIAAQALGYLADGSVTVPIDEILPLHQAPEAHRRLESRRTTGKLLLDPSQAVPS